MKFFIEQKALLAAIKSAVKFTHPRSPLPILSYGLLRVEESGVITMTASDMDHWLTLPLDGAAAEPGIYAVPLQLLTQLTRFLSGPLIITGEEESITVAAGEDSFTMVTVPATDYPAPPLFEATSSATLDMVKLRAMVKAVSPSCNDQDDYCRAVMTGMNMILRPGSFGLVATDGRRLSSVFSACDQAPEASIVIRGATLRAFTAIMRAEPLTLAIGATHAALEGWNITEDGLGWVADTPYLGKARGFLSAEVAGTAGMVIGFNGRYLLEGLSAIKGSTVEWCFQGIDAKSTLLRPVDSGDFISHDLVLMPVKLRDVAEELDNDWKAA